MIYTHQTRPYVNLKNDSYIHFHYHLEGGRVCSFKCKYIAKIIDYGRSYFKDDKTIQIVSKYTMQYASNRNVNRTVGFNKGFGWLAACTLFRLLHFWISSQLTQQKS